MYEQFFGLSENPFSLTPDPRFIFASRSHDEAVAHLRYWVEHHEGFAMITGEVGTGKTTALFRLIEGMGKHYEIAFLTNSTLTPVELLEEICRKFRVDLGGVDSKPALLQKLEALLARLRDMGHGAVLIIDEAQNFDHTLLEEVRLLSNMTRPAGPPLLQIALVGQPELERKLGLPELRQLRQRIGVHYRIEPLSEAESMQYVHHRVSVAGGYPRVLFPEPTVRTLHQKTHGLPREINQVASQALLGAFVEESTTVRPDHILSAIEEMNFKSVLDRPVTLTVTPHREPEPRTPPDLRPVADPAPPPAAPPAAPVTIPGPAELRPERPRAASPVAARLERPEQVASFGAIPPVSAGAAPAFRLSMDRFRRLLIISGSVALLAVAGFLTFAPQKPKGDELAELAAEATMPTPSPRTGAGPTPPATPSLKPAPVMATPDTAPRTSATVPSPAAVSAAAPPAVSRPAAGSGGYRLQVASLRDSLVADRFGRMAKSISGYDYAVSRSVVDSLVWYAVFLGSFATRQDADSAQNQIGGLDRQLAGAIVRPPR